MTPATSLCCYKHRNNERCYKHVRMHSETVGLARRASFADKSAALTSWKEWSVCETGSVATPRHDRERCRPFQLAYPISLITCIKVILTQGASVQLLGTWTLRATSHDAWFLLNLSAVLQILKLTGVIVKGFRV